MQNSNFNTIKETFKECLYKIAFQKIKYIESEPLRTLVNYVAEEYINVYTLLEFSSYTHLEVSKIEYNKHIKKHCKRILANDYDCSSYLKIDEYYIHLEHFSNVMHLLYQIAYSIDLHTLT
jgi:hypothetical protein